MRSNPAALRSVPTRSLWIAALLVSLSLVAEADSVRTEVREGDDTRVNAWIEGGLPHLLETYRQLHQNPELSLEEEKTAGLVAEALRRGGFYVRERVGGYGVLGVFENGRGPVLLIRGDMDALPVTENTGLPYASQVTSARPDGTTVGVMQACGHDVHVASLIGTAQLLAALKDQWRGTVVILAQPAEELGKGARMMIEDGLFKLIPRPDYAIALHLDGTLPAGQIGYVSGWAAANVDSVDITIYGLGGHGARPHSTIDPIVTAASLVSSLQTIVSRRVNPIEPAVVTVGSIHGGSKHNIIPDEVHLQLTVRSYSDEVRDLLLSSIEQLAYDTCNTFRCPRPPDFTIKDEYTPAMYNDPELSEAAASVFSRFLGEDNVTAMPAAMGGEDFGRYHRAKGFPAFMFRLGSVSQERWDAAQKGGDPLPSLHSSRYAPDPEPTLSTGVGAMARLSLALLGRPPIEEPPIWGAPADDDTTPPEQPWGDASSEDEPSDDGDDATTPKRDKAWDWPYKR
jgi:amidohydrolase